MDAGIEDYGEPDDIVHLYLRAHALADAELVDVSEIARQAGFVVPVAVTRAAWLECVSWPDKRAQSKELGQSEAGRLWDLLFTARIAAAGRRGPDCRYALYRVPLAGKGIRPRRVTLLMRAHAGDQGELVITIMLPTED